MHKVEIKGTSTVPWDAPVLVIITLLINFISRQINCPTCKISKYPINESMGNVNFNEFLGKNVRLHGGKCGWKRKKHHTYRTACML